MSKKQKTLRLMVSGSLLAAVAMVGVTVYQVERNQDLRPETEEYALLEEETDIVDSQEEHLGGNSTASLDEVPHHIIVDDEEEEIPESAETSSDEVTAHLEENKESEETKDVLETEETSGTNVILPELNFTEDTMLDWPVSGSVLMDYSMDHTVYFSTLDVYKYNPSVILSAEVGDPVEAAANSKIVKIEDSIETGKTITADLGNGYQVIYGQLDEVLVKENDVVTAGSVLGYVGEPSRFYTKEGCNLYFAMTKDGESIDPILYLP